MLSKAIALRTVIQIGTQDDCTLKAHPYSLSSLVNDLTVSRACKTGCVEEHGLAARAKRSYIEIVSTFTSSEPP